MTHLSDWSELPKDIYVIEAISHDGIGFDVKCCSVPMVTAPEVRYTRADLIAVLPKEPTLAMQNAFESAYWRKHAAGPDERLAVSDPFSEAYRAMLLALQSTREGIPEAATPSPSHTHAGGA